MSSPVVITLAEARRCFKLAIVPIVPTIDEWSRGRLDSTFGIRIGHLSRGQVQAMLREEFPELTEAQRRAVEAEFFSFGPLVDHLRRVHAGVERQQAATLDEVTHAARQAWSTKGDPR